MKKKILSLVLILCITTGLIPAMPIAVSAADFRYSVSDNETVTITYFRPSVSGVIEIPSTINNYPVTEIASSTFRNCKSLTSVVIPDTVTTIGAGAFDGCESLKSIVLSDGLTEIADGLFYDCKNLTSIAIPDSVTTIGHLAFVGCESLTSIVIPDGVTTIRSEAFDRCTGLTSVVIPDSVTSIGESAFSYCSNLIGIYVHNNNLNYCSENGVLFNKDKTTLIRSNRKMGEYTIPYSVTSIGESAFSGFTNLISIVIPDSVTTIGDRAFDSCTGLTSVVIPDSVTTIGHLAFVGCESLTSIVIPDGVTTIGYKAFDSCTGLTSVVIPDSVTTIGLQAFDSCTGLTSVVISDSVTTIVDCAFIRCESLTSIVIPDGVTTIGDWAFDGCKSLKNVYYSGSKEEWNKISIGDYNDDLKNAKIHYNMIVETTTNYRSELIKDAKLDVSYSDKYFTENNGYTYNHNLARASLALELSSWTAKDADEKNADAKMTNINSLYEQLGFDMNSIDQHNYECSLDDNSDKVAYSFATKKLYVGSTLVAVVVRGGGYGAEWRSNLHVGTGAKHAGFSIPAQEVYNNLDIYLSANNLDKENTKIWITGYSRGAAIANIVAGRINETGLINSDNLYAYTFATPNGVKVVETGANSSIHNNIYNIVLPYDFVPKVAMENWGYGRYGQTLMVKNINISSNKNHEKYFFNHTNKSYSVGKPQTAAAFHLRNALSAFGENQINYVSKYEGLIMDIIEWAMYRSAAKNEDLTDFVFTRYGEHENFSKALSHAYPYMSDYGDFSSLYKLGIDSSMVYSIVVLMYMNGIEMSENETIDFLVNKFGDVLKAMDVVGVFSVINGAGGTIDAHNPEYYISWLYAYDNPKDVYESSTYKKLTVACPVNVNVYDSYGELVVSVVNNKVVVDVLPVDVIGESAEIYFYEGEDIDDYTIEIEAYDEGNVNYSVTEYENNGVETRKIKYANIPFSTGTKLSGNVPKGQKLEAELYNLTSLTDGEETSVAFTDDLTGEDLQNLTVDVTVEGDGVANDIYFATKGELVVLEATPYHDATFLGWYDENDELISSNQHYSFILSKDMNAIAKFTKCTAVIFTSAPKISGNDLNINTAVSSAKDINGQYIIAIYSVDNKLLDTKIIPVSLVGNTDKEVNETFNVSLLESTPAYAKLFLWSGFDDLIPLCSSTKANIQ